MDFVNLPTIQQPIFPNKCVECGQASNILYKINSNRAFIYNWRDFVPLFGYDHSINVPAHKACALKLHRKHRQAVVTFLVPLLSGIAIVPFFSEESINYFLMAFFLGPPVFSLFVIIWLARKPIHFFFTIDGESACYYFADKEYAAEFAQLNGAFVNEKGKSHLLGEL